MDPRPRRRAQAVTYDGKQMPTGSAEDRLCDLDGCPRPSETLVASADGSVLLVCTSCASQMATPAARSSVVPVAVCDDTAPVPVVRAARHWEDGTAEFPAISDEVVVPAPTPAAAQASNRTGRSSGSRAWAFWARLVVGIALLVWGVVLLAGEAGAFDGVVTGAVGMYVLLNMARPRYRD